jgi:hypothetical protein
VDDVLDATYAFIFSLEPQLKQQTHLTDNKMQATHSLYERYSSMLLGYIVEVVKDRVTAEQCLVSVFNELPAHVHEVNSWVTLLLFAKKRLSNFTGTTQSGELNADGNNGMVISNRFVNSMTHEQQLIFCGVYYHHKAVGVLAKELDSTEENIRKVLKQAFAIIRKN